MAQSTRTVGLLHPGEMGTAIGASVVASGARVLWVSQGRGEATAARAREIGLEDVGTLAALARSAEIVLSVAPPHAALDVARAVIAQGFRGLYVDGNAVAPETARQIAALVEGAGARFVDGGIIGPANRVPGAARLYLSGNGAAEVAPLFAAGPIAAMVLDAPIGAASALKMSYAAWTKGSQALLASVRALATAEGVDAALLAEWKLSQPDVTAKSERAISENARKAWRFVGEMDEIARAMKSAGLTPGFHEAAGEIYRRLSAFKDTPPPSVPEALRKLLDPR
jgi:3-hydroxyisobutyrate dehydrogenase-like beta-hydroxyacid dehydrogenase